MVNNKSGTFLNCNFNRSEQRHLHNISGKRLRQEGKQKSITYRSCQCWLGLLTTIFHCETIIDLSWIFYVY